MVRKILRSLHLWLHELGRLVAWATLLVMAIGLAFSGVVAAVTASLYVAAVISKAAGGGLMIFFPVLFVMFALIGVYVSPYTGPHILKAFNALLNLKNAPEPGDNKS